ncbi:prepilin-type N-terminal cleavage/methylation domain-containing protein [Nitrospirillum iridis]|uniref:Prepilin-type N-terminal cleavage/methylation domain-containing protein n=1 Tax=Nitrospirillum iridis TaxID=765888 RepID=A0A7X0B0F2_9PROT|nr:prepilin-type N-terminal cleavage/methylation domain-containing protein [Nitrospirillum iridis]MBB6253385.1 prepilin-type N-terminal cleavage/methylation domain-containing protein [Nitrospirillum iridis]
MTALVFRTPAQYGMTLIEALVALMLLGLLALAGVELLPQMSRMADRSGTLQRGAAAMGRSHDFIRFVVENAVRQGDLGRVGGELPPLTADARQLELFAPLPSGLGTGGMYRIVMSTEGGLDHQALRLRVTPLRPDGPPASEGLLIEGATSLAWSYFDRKTNTWSGRWSTPDALPDLVRLDVKMPGTGWWPPLIAAPMLAGGVFCAFDTIANVCRQGGT